MKNLYKNHKGITLIALIITIIVLLILAGVTIAAITGNESAPNKAVEARQKNEQGAEFDAIKVAAVSSVVEGKLDLNVDIDTLKANLQGLVTDDLNRAIDPDLTEWTVTGNSGIKYLITNKGMVTLASTVDIARNGTTVTETTISLTVDDIGNTIQLTAKPTADLTVNSTTWESSNTSMATVDDTGTVTLLTTGSTTIKLTANTTGGNFTKTCIISIVKPLSVGDTVNYSTTLNGETLSDWKVFYKETKGNTKYTWIILSDYLPNSYVNISNISKSGSYKVYSNSRTNLINAMTIKENWSDLVNNGSINGTALSTEVKGDTNVKAMGSPILELWRDSWNANHAGENNDIFIDQNSTGYLVQKGNNPGSSDYSASMGNTGTLTNLYFPHTSATSDECYGYWLASPSANSAYRVMNVYYDGLVNGYDYDTTYFAFRPVVCLPSSVFE